MPKTVTCVDIHGKSYTVSTDKLKWRPSAYGIVIKDGAILLAKQHGGYDVPGGGIDLGEAPEEAVLREIKEETGIIAKNPRLVDVHTTFFKIPLTEDHFVESLLFYYICDYEGGEISLEHLEEYEKDYSELAEWVPLDQFNIQVTKGTISGTYDWRKLVKKTAGLT